MVAKNSPSQAKTAESTIETIDIAMLKYLLGEIATAANEADRTAYFRSGNCDFPEDDELLAGQMRQYACHMGWIAELALLELGVIPGNMPRDGDARAWLLPPVCRR